MREKLKITLRHTVSGDCECNKGAAAPILTASFFLGVWPFTLSQYIKKKF